MNANQVHYNKTVDAMAGNERASLITREAAAKIKVALIKDGWTEGMSLMTGDETERYGTNFYRVIPSVRESIRIDNPVLPQHESFWFNVGTVESIQMALFMDDKQTYYVSVYEVSRCYGGPEEGGWWYDSFSLVNTQPVGHMQPAKELKKYLTGTLVAENERRGPLSSSKGFEKLPEGGDEMTPRGYAGEATVLEVIIEDVPNDHGTKEIPQYE